MNGRHTATATHPIRMTRLVQARRWETASIRIDRPFQACCVLGTTLTFVLVVGTVVATTAAAIAAVGGLMTMSWVLVVVTRPRLVTPVPIVGETRYRRRPPSGDEPAIGAPLLALDSGTQARLRSEAVQAARPEESRFSAV